MFDRLATLVYRLRWLILPLGIFLLAVSYAGKDKALAGLSSHLGGSTSTESGRANTLLTANLANGGGDVLIVFDAKDLSAKGATRDAYVRLVQEALAPIDAEIAGKAELPPGAQAGRPTSVRTFYQGGTELQIAAGDPKITLALIDLSGTTDEKKKWLEQTVTTPLQNNFKRLANSDPQFREQFGVSGSRTDFRIYVTGGAATSVEAAALTKADAHRADRISLPLTLIMLVMIFGGVIAAIQPLFIGFLAAGVAIVLLGVFNQVIAVANVAGTVTAVLGLGLSIDYALLIVTRFREEIRVDRTDVLGALQRTLSTAGRSVLFSGIAVAIGLVSLAFIPLVAFRSLALAGIVTALMAISGALIILPAVLAISGPNIDRFNVLSVFRRRRAGATPAVPFFRRMAELVVRYPLPIALGTLALLVILALPMFKMRLGVSDYRILPSESPVREGYEVLVRGFGTGVAEPLKIAYQAPDLGTPEGIGRFWDYVHRQVETRPGIAKDPQGIAEVQSVVTVLDSRLAGTPPEQQRAIYQAVLPWALTIRDPAQLATPPNSGLRRDELEAVITLRDAAIKGDTALVEVSPAGNPQSATARALVRDLRESANRPPGPARALIGGTPAQTLDYIRQVTQNIPWMVLFIFVLTYLVLWALLGSLTLPLIGFVLNVVSLGASFGAVVFIFQEGNFADVLRFSKLEQLDATVPVTLFAVAFALSMDYQVFLLSRIREEYDRTGEVKAGIVNGLSHTAGIITGAALTLLAVLAAYGTASNALVKSLTVGMFIAVLVDATIVRTFLVPAVLQLFGKWAWYSPPAVTRAWKRLGLAERG